MYVDPTVVVYPENPNKDCKEECRFKQLGPVYGTGIFFYNPIYDKTLRNTNPNPFTQMRIVLCQTCGRKWQFKIKNHDVEKIEIS